MKKFILVLVALVGFAFASNTLPTDYLPNEVDCKGTIEIRESVKSSTKLNLFCINNIAYLDQPYQHYGAVYTCRCEVGKDGEYEIKLFRDQILNQ